MNNWRIGELTQNDLEIVRQIRAAQDTGAVLNDMDVQPRQQLFWSGFLARKLRSDGGQDYTITPKGRAALESGNK